MVVAAKAFTYTHQYILQRIIGHEQNPTSGISSSLASLPNSIATKADKRKNRGISSESFVFPAPVPDRSSEQGKIIADHDRRRRTLPSTSGRARPEPIPLASFQPVTPPLFVGRLSLASWLPLASPLFGNLPGLPETPHPAEESVRERLVFFGILLPDLASTQISQPVYRWRGHRKAD